MSMMWGGVERNPHEFSAVSEAPLGRGDWRHPERLMHVPVDFKETTDAYDFFCDLPGMKREDVGLKLVGKHTLSISGRRARAALEGPDGVWHQEERPMGSFIRKFHLPDKTNLDAITATVQDGVLRIHLPKLTPGPHEEHANVTHIPIS